MIDLDRLQAQLRVSGIQQTNNPLFQVIQQLINAEKEIQNLLAATIAGITDITNNITVEDFLSPIVMINTDGNTNEPLIIPGPPGPRGLEGKVGVPGLDGIDGLDGFPIPGRDGLAGIAGRVGIDGIDGNDGMDGSGCCANWRSNQPLPLTIVASATYTTLSSDYFIKVTANPCTVTLSSAVNSPGRVYVIDNESGGNITVDTTGGQTIEGAASQTVPDDSAMAVYSDGANWRIF